MTNAHHKTLLITTALMLGISLSGCSAANKIRGFIGDDGGVDYQKNKSIKQLEVPPDLTQPEFDRAFDLPTGIVSAVSLKNGTAMPQLNATNFNSNVGTARRGDLSSIRTVAGKTVLQVNDTYPRALILTEIMLTRMGFSTASKSSSGDVITAKYNGSDVTVDGKRKGFFSKAKSLVGLGGENNKALTRGESYRVTVKNEKGSPIVRIAPTASKVLSAAANTKVITLLNSAFNK